MVAAPAGATDTNPANNTASDTDTIGSAGGTADSRVTKAHASPIVSGGTTVYTIVVSNLGPQPADGAVLVDPSVAGLDKTSASCGGATGGAQCPVSPTIGELQSGIAIPVLPVSGSVTFTVAAHVIASTGTVSNNSTVTPPAGLTDPNPNDNQVVDSGPVNPPKGGGPGPVQQIPTLDLRALILLAIGMALTGAACLRRSRRTARRP